jgi:hypothetical protein
LACSAGLPQGVARDHFSSPGRRMSSRRTGTT